MQSMIPLIFLLFLIPGTVYGYVGWHRQEPSRHHCGHEQVMSTMGYYLTMIFFCAQFTAAFAQSIWVRCLQWRVPNPSRPWACRE